MTCREQVKKLCEEYGVISVLQEVQHHLLEHANELDGELPQDAKACRAVEKELRSAAVMAVRIQN